MDVRHERRPRQITPTLRLPNHTDRVDNSRPKDRSTVRRSNGIATSPP